MLFRLIVATVLFFNVLHAFETTNVQILYSNNFKGDSFIYDTVDGKKTTLTFEHYRTFSLGDFYMFVDVMDGEKFDGSKHEVYTEIDPRFSLSKISNANLSFSIIKDVYIATQLNSGYDYTAYLGGLGVDFDLPYFIYFTLNAYYKSDNFENDTYQITPAYKTVDYKNIHFEGFMDITSRDFNTQNQLLYNLSSLFPTKEKIYLGTEWIYYKYNHNGRSSKTDTFQVMFKYEF